MLNQVRDVQAGLIKVADKVQSDLRLGRDVVILRQIVLHRYMKGCHAVSLACVGALLVHATCMMYVTCMC